MIFSKKAVHGLIILTIALGGWMRVRNLEFDREDKRNRSPDEIIYTAYASVITHEGLKGTKISVEEYNKNEKLWIMPPPTRIGYLYPLAGVMKLAGRYDKDVGLYFSVVVAIFSMILIAGLCLKFFDPLTALFATTFVAVSPMELAFARKVWQDGFMTFLGGGLLWLAFEILKQSKKYLWIAVFALIGAYACLTKESGAVYLGLLSIGLIVLLLFDKRFREAIFILTFVGSACVLGLLVLTMLSGGREPLVLLYDHVKNSVSNNQYALQYQGESWYALLESLALLSPMALIFSIAGLIGALLNKSEKRRELCLTAFILLSFVTAASIPDYFKNVRYLSPVYPLFYLLAAYGVHWIVSWAGNKKDGFTAASLGVIILLAVIASDLLNFNKIFIDNHAKDLSNPLLREASLFSAQFFDNSSDPIDRAKIV